MANIFLIIILLFLSAFFSGAETALISINRFKLRNLSEKGEKKAKLIQQVLKEPEKLLSAILISNNFITVLITSLVTVMAICYFKEKAIWIATIFTTFIILIFGEIVPKTFASQYTKLVSYLVIYPIFIIIQLLFPLVKIFSFITNLLLLGRKKLKKEPTITEEEIKTIIHLGQEEGILEEEEKKMLGSVMKFTDTIVKEVMIPRSNIVALNIGVNYERLKTIIFQEGYSRFPVYEGNFDNIIGLLYVKDLLLLEGNVPVILQDLFHPPYFVSEQMKAKDLLQEFKKKRKHMAIVVNRFGRIVGLVTLEDLLEEIVGEIADEYDKKR